RGPARKLLAGRLLSLVRGRPAMKTAKRVALMLALTAFLDTPHAARAGDGEAACRAAVKKGWDYLAAQQHKDGHWEDEKAGYPTTLTAMCGLALLMEGSTVAEGKYRDNIRRAIDYLLSKSQKNGLLCDTA